MPITADIFLADVTAIVIGGLSQGSFGSGRLIAPNIVLTAGHVVDFPCRESPRLSGWRVRLIKERTVGGNWVGDAHTAKVVWRHPGEIDLALLEILDEPTHPTSEVAFGLYDLNASLRDTDAAGFPEARWNSEGIAREYKLKGTLRIADQKGPFAWTVERADTPDLPTGWKGMSGAAVAYAGVGQRLYLLGVIQEIPSNFSLGQLSVARVAGAFEDQDFVEILSKALGEAPRLMRCGEISSDPSRRDATKPRPPQVIGTQFNIGGNVYGGIESNNTIHKPQEEVDE